MSVRNVEIITLELVDPAPGVAPSGGRIMSLQSHETSRKPIITTTIRFELPITDTKDLIIYKALKTQKTKSKL
jgi:hypothetical protein